LAHKVQGLRQERLMDKNEANKERLSEEVEEE
jgi:hypothetical protein